MPAGVIGAVSTRIGLVLLAALGLMVASGCRDSPEVKKERSFARAERYLNDRRYNEAVIEFQNALQVDPHYVPALHGLGRAYAAKYFVFGAVQELGRARRLAPDSISVATDYGRALVEIGAWSEADAEAARIAEREPDNPDAAYIRAVSLLGQAKARECVDLLDRLPPAARFAEIDAVRGEALLNLGQPDLAEPAFRAALAADPKDARGLTGLGAVSLAQGKYEAAVKHYLQAKALRPEVPRIRLWLAAAMARLGQTDQAIAELEEVELQARTPDIGMALALHNLQADRPEQAVAHLAPIVRVAPRMADARLLLASAYLAAGSPDNALVELQELERQLPEEPAVQFRLALAEVQLGRPQEALARLDAIGKVYERVPSYRVERARALLLLGRLGEAQKEAEAAQRLAPTR
ncbi:MAG TPA: tetratricopeptide repeat protein, partial [Candidatus Binatia bacterium]|nr:tetratricopeptide repeat protein [Candidatus Binatia bacterium]